MADEKPSRRLNIFLLKSEAKKAENALAESVSAKAILDISLNSKKIGQLVTNQAPNRPPEWLKYFSNIDQAEKIELSTKHASATLFIEASNRLFAITFGYGRFLINQDMIERNFGLKVVLNAVPPESIRSIDRTEFEQNEIHSRDQASQATDIADFGIDIDRDILRAVSGTPAKVYKELGRTISGSDSFCCVSREPLEGLRPFLKELLAIYQKHDYKAHYPWVDNIVAVKDNPTIDKLNSILVDSIRNSATSDIWMAVPEIIDWDEIEGFTYGGASIEGIKSDISLDNFLDVYPNATLTLQKLKAVKIYALRAQDSSTYRQW